MFLAERCLLANFTNSLSSLVTSTLAPRTSCIRSVNTSLESWLQSHFVNNCWMAVARLAQ